MTEYRIGIDSTDSAELGMCTTYLGAVLLERLEELPVELSSYPELVRLNPNVPWKTRGNGAVAFDYTGPTGLEDDIFQTCSSLIDELSVLEDPQTNPGLVVSEGGVPLELGNLYREALHGIVDLDKVKDLLGRSAVPHRGWKNGRGLIGAASAAGADLREFTYECMVYRPGHIKDRVREVDIVSLIRSAKGHPGNFFNVSPEGKPVCIPHSPCPVIFGIRGVHPREVREAALEVKASHRERWVLWRTNQHTDAHIREVHTLSDAQPYSSVAMDAIVSSAPEYRSGGHLSFEMEVSGERLTGWAYEPTKGFRKRLAGLLEGDLIKVWGSIRKEAGSFERGINLERVEVFEAVEVFEEFNPECPECGGSTESMGSGQGLRCRSCGYRNGLEKKRRKVERRLKKGVIEPPPEAWRHLFRPLGIEPSTELQNEGPFHGKLDE